MNPVPNPVPATAVAAASGSRLADLGLFLLGALALALPSGLAGFAACLLLSTVMHGPALRRGAARMGLPLRVLVGLSVAVLAMGVLSNVLFEHGWRDVGYRSRFLALPWIALWAYSLGPRLQSLWWGALAGVAVALGLALGQVLAGLQRADGWTNAIVFADSVLVLLVVVSLCRPHGRWPWLVAALLAGCAAIVLSGSRGVWLGLACLLALLVWGARWRSPRQRGLALAGAVTILAVLVVNVPGLDRQMRLLELRTDMQRLEHGDADSSAGARLELWRVAYQSFREHPLTGIGVGRFGSVVKQDPACRADPSLDYCQLGHAHNDVAEWGAAQGVPGSLLLLAVYGLPLWLFVRLYRASGRRRWRGPAAAGATLVVAYAMCGITQSMFAHQLSVGLYVAFVGALLGLAAREAEAAPVPAA